VSALGDRLASAHLPVTVGPVLTVSTVTGTEGRAADLAGRWRPVAEAMEGFGVATAARAQGRPIVEVRAVCNPVGRRDRSAWDLPRALGALGDAAAALFRPTCHHDSPATLFTSTLTTKEMA
jgi:futalosine hydrolase